jgi:beta-glucosidase-like glycosyl hydrolase
MQGTPEAQAKLTNKYQQAAQVPLLIGMDAEWGLGMRLTGVTDYPRQMMLGATRDTLLMKEIGAAVAAQCKRLGVHIDFAPDIDINNNPKNPIINFRSFGDDKEWVARMGIAYMKGLQENGVIACAKHFPGHGDVSVDSHKDLPVINKSQAQMEALELYPFRDLIHAGVKSIMIAHLSVPALENTPHLPTTLSKKVVTGLLKDKMGFDGLVITDALNMQGVTKYYPNGETDLRAFLAGNNILLFSQDVPLATQKIKNAIHKGEASEQMLEYSVKKILAAKYDAGLSHFEPIQEEGVTADLNRLTDRFKRRTALAALTLVKDQHRIISKLQSGKPTVAYLNINGLGASQLQSELQRIFPNLHSQAMPAGSSADKALDFVQRNQDEVLIVGIHNLTFYPGSGDDYGLTAAQLTLIKRLAQEEKVIFLVFGNAYLMKYLCDAPCVIVAYEDDKFTEDAAFRVLTGKIKARGTLPVTACD